MQLFMELGVPRGLKPHVSGDSLKSTQYTSKDHLTSCNININTNSSYFLMSMCL